MLISLAAGAGCRELMMFRECVFKPRATFDLKRPGYPVNHVLFRSLWFPGRRRADAFCYCVCASCFFNVSAPLLPRNTRIIIEQVSGCLGTLCALSLQQIMQQALARVYVSEWVSCPLQPASPPPLWLIIEGKCAPHGAHNCKPHHHRQHTTRVASNQCILQLWLFPAN